MGRRQIPSFPQEIMLEILLRLPAKSIGRFRCVSKPWSVLLSDTQFISTHLNNRRTEDNLILIFENQSIRTIADVRDDNLSRTIRFQPELHRTWTHVMGSCNGLVLLLDNEKGLFLVNPTTLKQVKLPDLPGLKRPICFVYGLGYDATSDDYKVLAIFDPYGDEIVLSYECVYMYSMRRGDWKRLECFPYNHAIAPPIDGYDFWPGAFLDGSIHWVACTTETEGSPAFVIVAFDLVDEKFKEIPAPGCLDVKTYLSNELTVLKGCLCMFNKWHSLDQLDIWIMEEYGIDKSWIKLSIAWGGWVMVKPLCFIGDDKIVLVIDEFRLIVYTFKTGASMDFMVHGVPAMVKDGGTFVDSLVWPEYNDLM